MPWLFITIVFLVIMFNVRLRYVNKKYDAKSEREKYLQEDADANYARVRPIDESMIITLTEGDLPFRYDYDKTIDNENAILKAQEKVKHHLGMPLIKTDISTNIEVKRRFGAANLQKVIVGEENLTRLIQRLNRWGRLLLEAGNAADAEIVLRAAVDCRSDISETYTLLYDFYTCLGADERLAELEKRIESLPETAKALVKKHINGQDNSKA